MGFSNAQRQARHRDRVKETLRNAAEAKPLRNDILETLQFAYITGERHARHEALQAIEEKGVLAANIGWEGAAEVLNCDKADLSELSIEFFVGLVAASGARVGAHLVSEIYREVLAIEAARQRQASPPTIIRKGRKGVT